MTNTSATGGFLLPEQSPAPLEGDDLDDFFQEIVSGVTGIDINLVRPRWQETPPPSPKRGTNWAAIGVMNIDAEFDGYIGHVGAGEGKDNVRRYETIEVLTSFYGPECLRYAALLRDGLSVPQNSEPFQLHQMGLADLGSLLPTADLVNQAWLRRVDFTFRVRRTVFRTYPVLNLKSLDTDLDTNSGA
ncbi:hypothetical protein M8994_18385 [Brucella sp. 21LCYQ03]|nr:hypothetical protein [Brucella sp. 21LCYQ03]